MTYKPSKKELESILKKYLEEKATPEDETFLNRYFDYLEDQPGLSTLLSEAENKKTERRNWELLAAQMNQPTHAISPGRKWRWMAAASIILAVGLSSWFFFLNKNDKQQQVVQNRITSDIKPPEVNRATITLTNGQTVYLDSAAVGSLAVQGTVKLVKLANGKIAYQTESGESIKELTYNTLTNPKGSQVVDMTLADGSRVWLNAGSSITYPIVFIGNERTVSITGEAYFQVASDKTKPFRVSKGDMQVEVLGTHFNVNAYDDERDIKVTLLEGAVRLKMNEQSRILKPGEQATVSNTISVANDVDVEAVMAWKDGRFKFSGVDIETIMRQAARWYNIDVEYQGKVEGTLSGGVARDVNASQLLHVLELTERVQFEIEGRKVIVRPK
ncbi:MAG: FecR domain-containing protein [Chitinophagaceae bacterium]|nr:FecR domain-containing protein [Chitinophagaceae bacterium]